jgi:hypothetical protein
MPVPRRSSSPTEFFPGDVPFQRRVRMDSKIRQNMRALYHDLHYGAPSGQDRPASRRRGGRLGIVPIESSRGAQVGTQSTLEEGSKGESQTGPPSKVDRKWELMRRGRRGSGNAQGVETHKGEREVSSGVSQAAGAWSPIGESCKGKI